LRRRSSRRRAARLPSVSRERQSNGRPAVLWLVTRGLLRCRQRCRCARNRLDLNEPRAL
jgi:hypothetical protein